MAAGKKKVAAKKAPPKKGAKPSTVKAAKPSKPAKPVKAPPKPVAKAPAAKVPPKAAPKPAPPAPKPVPPAKAPPKAPPAPKPAPPEPAAAAPKPVKKPAVPTIAPPVAPVLKPTATAPQKVVQAPLPPPVRHGAVDSQIFSAINYGLFAAINKTFGSFGQSVVKNASLRILEYGYKKQWLPPKSKDPIKALNEFFGRLETMGYAEKIHIAKKGEEFVCEITEVADWDAIAQLKELHYQLLPIFSSEIILAFLDQYFGLIVAMEPVELVPEKRGLRIRFTTHTRAEPLAPTVHERPIHADLED